MDFIQEVQMKTSNVEAEYGGALGGVVNVIMEKGTNKWHGGIFSSYQDGAMNGSPTPTLRYDPSSAGCPAGAAGCPKTWSADPTPQSYQPIRPHTSVFYPASKLAARSAIFFQGSTAYRTRFTRSFGIVSSCLRPSTPSSTPTKRL